MKSVLFFIRFLCLTPGHTQSTLTTQWQSYLDSLHANQHVTGILIHVESPEQNISWTGASGVSEVESQKRLTGHEPLRIASITKTFVATAILRLWEEGKLSLNDPIAKYISEEHSRLIREGGYNPEDITIRHLLTHTSGLFDHGSSAQFMNHILDDPQRHWTRTEQIQGSMTWGLPVGKPGERYSYSDTGYILLGEVIEDVTRKSLGIALRELIDFEKQEMDDTWFEITEETPVHVAPRMHQYLDTIDTYDFHASLDLYGGGGIVATMEDLTDFYLGLFAHSIYTHTSTLDTMLAYVSRSSPEKPKLDYRKGIWLQPYTGFDAWTHSGFWGVQVWYVPEFDTAIAIAVTRQDDFGVVKGVLERVVGGLRD